MASNRTTRCTWVPLGKPLYVAYHDEQWGVPEHDDRALFEMLVLEGAQAGLSWETILNKREGYRRAFERFDPRKVARYDAHKVRALLADPRIVRNRLKVLAAIANARAFLAVQREFGSFDAYIWPFVGGKPKRNAWRHHREVPARTPESDAMSRDLKRRGFRFVGSTICYAFMQACGLVNDHTTSCFRYRAVGRAGAASGRRRGSRGPRRERGDRGAVNRLPTPAPRPGARRAPARSSRRGSAP